MRGLIRCAPVVLVFMSSVVVQGQNLLSNPGFEDPITQDGPPFVGSWEGFNGDGNASAGNSTAMPRSGFGHLSLSILNTDMSFAGAFQDVPNLTSGEPVVFSGWHATPSNPLGLTVEIRIEWLDAGNNEITRTPNLSPIPTAQYSQFMLASVVPPGAETARVVYAIQTFSPEPTNNGTVYLDDVSFVPEPSTALLAGIAGLALACRRPRRTD